MRTNPPFEPRIENDWLYGRGAGDMKAGLAANIFAMDALGRFGYQPANEVYLQFAIEEECTGNGTLSCIQRRYQGGVMPESDAWVPAAATCGGR